MTTPDSPRTGIDRRSALKKAAAAGTIAWTAPTILSDTAHATVILPNGCTAKCLPLGTGTGLVRASATCEGQGVRRAITISIDLSAVQTFTCPCGGDPRVTDITCTSNVGTCTVGAGGAIQVNIAGRLATGILTVRVNLTETAACSDRDGDDCFASCTTTVVVNVPIPDRGNCRGFPNNNLTPTVSTTCSPASNT